MAPDTAARCSFCGAIDGVTSHAGGCQPDDMLRDAETGELYDPTCGPCVAGIDPSHTHRR